MAAASYVINEEVFTKLYDKSKELYANISIIKTFCDKYKDMDEFNKIIPLIDYTYKTSDILFTKIINIEYPDED